MKILNENGEELQFEDCDLTLGYLQQDQIVSVHHEATPAIEAVEEEGHWKVIAEYPNGGKDVEWVIDVPGVEAQEAKEAYDEYEDIQRYIPYTEEELAQKEAEKLANPTVEDRVNSLEEKLNKILELLGDKEN